ncbi:hypothetical protein SEA_LIGMA_45 [Gordonia phage Ligma]|nr:hypothetical protein SEA_LIGMA_45 [Gordonia phage Ligma]UQT02146.1 hypothetical protein SEA_AXUMITE_45 [Gordonia phage Axumite]
MSVMDLDTTTLAEARAWLEDRLDDGAPCPCCEQNVKVYRRKITSPMARGLLRQYREVGRRPAHSASLVKAETHEFSQLAWWNLITEEPGRREDGGRAGWWSITPAGEQFALGHTRLPKYAHIYDGRVLDLDEGGETVDIHDALGARFHYGDLMAGV